MRPCCASCRPTSFSASTWTPCCRHSKRCWFRSRSQLRRCNMASRTVELRSSPIAPSVHRGTEHRDLISIADFSPAELESLLHLARLLKANPHDFRGTLDGQMVVLFFEKPSLRTWPT